jgi:2-oxoglutarate ferredoxin oxidoreductase subunit alpha
LIKNGAKDVGFARLPVLRTSFRLEKKSIARDIFMSPGMLMANARDVRSAERAVLMSPSECGGKVESQEPEKILAKGNEAIAMAAIDSGCLLYFGYPITPQNDIPEYLSKHLPAIGGEFIQAESELASINLLLGASATGARAMTSSSSPGISLMQEGISYLAGSELPGLIVNISRSGPGLGGISPSQGDYFQATRGGGHGDYRMIVLAPSSVQEMYDLTCLAFNLSDKYRNPALILGDAMIGQMKEPLVREKCPKMDLPPKNWTLTGAQGRNPNRIKSLYLQEGELSEHNWKLHQKYEQMKRKRSIESLTRMLN